LEVSLHVITCHPRSPSQRKGFSCIVSQDKELQNSGEIGMLAYWVQK
jgi:hypothetical protein